MSSQIFKDHPAANHLFLFLLTMCHCLIVSFPFFDFILGALFLFIGGESWDGRAQGKTAVVK